MKNLKFLSSLAFVAALVLTISACQKEPLPVQPSVPNLSSDATGAPDRSAVTLTVTCLTNRTQPLGGSFQHKVKLLNNGTPMSGQTVGINDPIGLICTWVTTNSLGEATWTRTVPTSSPRKAYTVEFFYGSVKQYSTVAVQPAAGAFNFTNYPMDFTSTTTLSTNTLVGADRGGFPTTYQDLITTLGSVKQAGYEIGKDYLSNPFNFATATIAAISCGTAIIVPPVGTPFCLASGKMVVTGLSSSAAKILLTKGIDASSMTPSQKTQFKNWVNLGQAAYAVAKATPNKGIEALDQLAASYDLINSMHQLIYDNSGNLRGASFPAQRSGTNEVYMMCIYKKP